MTNWTAQDLGRLVVTAALLAMFGFTLVYEVMWGKNADAQNLLIGALIGAFSTGAVQFWFGTTPSSSKKDDTIAQMATNTQAALASTPPAAPLGKPLAGLAALGAMFLVASLLLGSGHAYAASKPREGLCSPPNCICATGAAAQACLAGGGGGNSEGTVIQQLIAAKGDILKTLQVIDSMSRQPIAGTDPVQEWAPDVHFCIAGYGTEGQPGYVPGLAAFVAGIQTPPEPPAVPPGTKSSPLLALFEADLATRAAQLNLDKLMSQGAGIPVNLRTTCGGVLVNASARIQTLAALIALLIPK